MNNLPPGVTLDDIERAQSDGPQATRDGIPFFHYDAGTCWDCGVERDAHDNWRHPYTLRMVPDLRCVCEHLRSEHYTPDQLDVPFVDPYCDGDDEGCECPQYVARVLPGAQQVFEAALKHLGVGEPVDPSDLPF